MSDPKDGAQRPSDNSPRPSAPTPSAYIENFSAPELFVNDLSGIALASGNVHMTFTSFRRNVNHTAGAHVVNLRLVMPAHGFKAALALMQIAVENSEKKGE